MGHGCVLCYSPDNIGGPQMRGRSSRLGFSETNYVTFPSKG